MRLSPDGHRGCLPLRDRHKLRHWASCPIWPDENLECFDVKPEPLLLSSIVMSQAIVVHRQWRNLLYESFTRKQDCRQSYFAGHWKTLSAVLSRNVRVVIDFQLPHVNFMESYPGSTQWSPWVQPLISLEALRWTCLLV